MNIKKQTYLFYQVILILFYGINTFCMHEEEDKLKKEYEKNKSLLAAYNHSIQAYPPYTYLKRDPYTVFAGYPDIDDHNLIPEHILEECSLRRQDEQRKPKATLRKKSNFIHIMWYCPGCPETPGIKSYLNLYNHIMRCHKEQNKFKCPYNDTSEKCKRKDKKIEHILHHVCKEHTNLRICCKKLWYSKQYQTHKKSHKKNSYTESEYLYA